MKMNTMMWLIPLSLVIAGTAFAGSVTGTIVYAGKAPIMKPIDMSADPICHSVNEPEPTLNEVLVLGEGNTMANVFVEVVSGLPEKEWSVPSEPVILTQAGCKYSPRVFGIRAGQKLEVKNPDGTIHNVNGLPMVNPPFNKGMPKTQKSIEMTFELPEEMFQFRCDVHPWMRAYCTVMAHPFFAVSAEDGKFEIKGLEPGEYEIRATHEKLKSQKMKVTVTADKAAVVDFSFSR